MLLVSTVGDIHAWPLDDADDTGIGRLEYQRRVERGELSGRRQPPGAKLPTSAVDLRLLDQPDFSLPKPDFGFTQAIKALLGERESLYSVAILDLSDADKPIYGEHRSDVLYNPGSVGKLLVALAWLQATADHFGDDLDARWDFLRNTDITADGVIVRDSHTVRRWDASAEELIRRPLEVGDPGSLFEFLDWMVSPSSNAAASVLIRQAMLFRQFGDEYPLTTEAAESFFETTPGATKSALLKETLQGPVTRNGFDIVSLRQGSLFTRAGKALVAGESSRASAASLLQFLVTMEQGQLVDEFSSRILKKLMYVTERRIRYATAPALKSAAVYFKSGSWYGCKEEPGFVCRKYMGNVRNLMHSVAIVEAPPGDDEQASGLHYIVVMMSNVLRRNSAEDHMVFAGAIHGLIAARHRTRSVEPEPQQTLPAPSPQLSSQSGPQPGPQQDAVEETQ